jgi:hypothetical protein
VQVSGRSQTWASLRSPSIPKRGPRSARVSDGGSSTSTHSTSACREELPKITFTSCAGSNAVAAAGQASVASVPPAPSGRSASTRPTSAAAEGSRRAARGTSTVCSREISSARSAARSAEAARR